MEAGNVLGQLPKPGEWGRGQRLEGGLGWSEFLWP